MTQGKLKILLVEDNPADVRLLQETLKQTSVPWELTVAPDGVEAETILYGAKTPAARPDLVLLDLNLPKKSGHELLRDIKSDIGLRTIPVIIFSSSQAASDISAAYEEFANCYISKPVDLDQFAGVVRVIEEFWHRRAELPRA